MFTSILNLSRFDWYTRFYKWILTMRSFVCHNAAPNTRHSNLLFKWASRWVSAHVEWYRFRKRVQKFWATMLRSWLKQILQLTANHRTLANMMSANVCPTVTDGISSRSATTWNSTGAENSMWTGCPAWHNKDESTKITFLKTCYLFKHLLYARVNLHLSKFAHWHVLNLLKPTRGTVLTPHSF